MDKYLEAMQDWNKIKEIVGGVSEEEPTQDVEDILAIMQDCYHRDVEYDGMPMSDIFDFVKALRKQFHIQKLKP